MIYNFTNAEIRFSWPFSNRPVVRIVEDVIMAKRYIGLDFRFTATKIMFCFLSLTKALLLTCNTFIYKLLNQDTRFLSI